MGEWVWGGGDMENLLPVKRRRMPRAGVNRGVETVHHVMTRVCGQAFLLTDVEKEVFRELLGRVAGFCGVEVITYALLENHFHLLVEVPGEPGELSDEALLARARLLYGKERKGQPLSIVRIEAALRAGGEVRSGMRALLMGRMASLPMFMKILKQRYSILFNRKFVRAGTLWEGRFRGVLVENTRAAIRAVGAYIDLNAVRAGVVADPKDYRWSGYGEAAGSRGGVQGYALFVHLAGKHAETVEQVAAAYRRFLYVSGGFSGKGKAFTPEAIAAVVKAGGELSTAQWLRCRLRYMTQGAVIGTKAFVGKWVAKLSATLRGGEKKAHADDLEGLLGDAELEICALRLRKKSNPSSAR
jgi:putative transposase